MDDGQTVPDEEYTNISIRIPIPLLKDFDTKFSKDISRTKAVIDLMRWAVKSPRVTATTSSIQIQLDEIRLATAKERINRKKE